MFEGKFGYGESVYYPLLGGPLQLTTWLASLYPAGEFLLQTNEATNHRDCRANLVISKSIVRDSPALEILEEFSSPACPVRYSR